jgi:Peptidase family M48
MAGSPVFPLLVTLVVAALATSSHRRLPPRLATRFVTIALALVVLAALPTALVIAAAFLAHAPVVGFGFEWCARAMGLHGSVPAWLGVPVVVLITFGAVRTIRLLRQHRTLRLDESRPIHFAHSHKPYAVTLPGRAGQIVISTAMVDLLDDDEQLTVVAHERAHARYRHDRYLLTARLTVARSAPSETPSRSASCDRRTVPARNASTATSRRWLALGSTTGVQPAQGWSLGSPAGSVGPTTRTMSRAMSSSRCPNGITCSRESRMLSATRSADDAPRAALATSSIHCCSSRECLGTSVAPSV